MRTWPHNSSLCLSPSSEVALFYQHYSSFCFQSSQFVNDPREVSLLNIFLQSLCFCLSSSSSSSHLLNLENKYPHCLVIRSNTITALITLLIPFLRITLFTSRGSSKKNRSLFCPQISPAFILWTFALKYQTSPFTPPKSSFSGASVSGVRTLDHNWCRAQKLDTHYFR